MNPGRQWLSLTGLVAIALLLLGSGCAVGPDFKRPAAPSADGYGNTALAMLRRSPAPDVLLLELSLPDMDGFAIIRECRASRSSISIIVVSKHSHEQAIVEALDLGADDYLTKPFGAQELFARIRTAFRHRKDTNYISRPATVRGTARLSASLAA